MLTSDIQLAILDSLKDPLLFVNTDHIIRYMNPAAEKHYSEGRTLLGKSIMDCHNEHSCQMMLAIFEKMRNGLEEEKITDDDKHRIYMHAVRDANRNLLGYYERYEWK